MLAYQLGDEFAFEELYSRYSARVLAFLRSKLRNEAKARDVFQGTFFKLHRTRDRYNPSLPFVPWLFTICRSELLDALKKEKRLREDVMSEVPELPSTDLEPNFGVDFSSLPEGQRQAVELRYNQESSFEEIARALETTPANARQMVSRAIRQLRSLYAKKD